jgi:hypothetical protein
MFDELERWRWFGLVRPAQYWPIRGRSRCSARFCCTPYVRRPVRRSRVQPSSDPVKSLQIGEDGRCWARTSDLRLVETALSQLS